MRSVCQEGESNQWTLPELQDGAAEVEPTMRRRRFGALDNHFCATVRHILAAVTSNPHR